MNILFLTLSRSVALIEKRSIYSDLMREFVNNGHEIYIMNANERCYGHPTQIFEYPHVKILRVRTLNIQKTNVIEKGIGTLSLEYLFKKAIKRYWNNIKFDLVLYSTPPITFNNVIEYVKKKYGAKSYLLLKDIFPQNAVDLGMFSKSSFIYKMFRKKEERLYQISDFIGCMSPANVKYVLEHNPFEDAKKVEVCPNSIEIFQGTSIDCPKDTQKMLKGTQMDAEGLKDTQMTLMVADNADKKALFEKYGIPLDKTIFIYGGNLGKPQGIDFLLKVVEANEKSENSFIAIVGSGTEFHRIENWFKEHHPKNALLKSVLPKSDYDRLVSSCDVGLIFLDSRFTIPNYPSRLLSYLENKMPIIMATDKNTDIGSIAHNNGYGEWVESGDLDGFMAMMDKLSSNAQLRKEMGEKGYQFLLNNYTVTHSYNIIMRHFM